MEKTGLSYEKTERQGNVITLQRPEGIYSIIYGMHNREDDEKIPYGVDGICFEWGVTKFPTTHYNLKKIGASGNQKQAFNYAEQNELPLLATDCSLVAGAMLLEGTIPAIKAIFSAPLIMRAVEIVRGRVKKTGITRRDFLEIAFHGSASPYLLLPFAAQIGQGLSTYSGIGVEHSTKLRQFTKKIHPDFRILIEQLREIIIAQKMFFLFTQGYRHLAATLGRAHIGIEDAILATERARLDWVSDLRPILAASTIPETIYQIYEYRISSEGKWGVVRILEEPNLRKIVLG